MIMVPKDKLLICWMSIPYVQKFIRDWRHDVFCIASCLKEAGSSKTTLWKSWKHDKHCLVQSLVKFSIFNLRYVSFKILKELLKQELLKFVHNRVSQYLRGSLDSGCRCTSSEHHLMVRSGILVVFHSVRTHLEHQKQKLGPVPISFQQGSSEFVLQVWQ